MKSMAQLLTFCIIAVATFLPDATAVRSCVGSESFCFDISPQTANATSSENSVVFRLEAPQTVGWVAVGVGSDMVGAYIMIAWPNSDGSVTLSQRKASAYSEPKVTNQQTDLTLDNQSSGIKNGKFVAVFSRPSTVNGNTIDTTSSENFIWAFSNTKPKSSAIDASLTQHSSKGSVALELSVSNSSVSLTNQSGLTRDQKLVIAHAAFMFSAWLVFAPLAIFIARFGRRILPRGWFHLHWGIQLFVTTSCAVAGYALILLQNGTWGPELRNNHVIIGHVLFWGLIAQLALGGIHHKLFRPDRGYTPWWTKLHWWFGRSIITLAFVQVYLGLRVYKVQNGLIVAYFVYIGIILFAFIMGSIFLYLRQRKDQKNKNGHQESFALAQ